MEGGSTEPTPMLIATWILSASMAVQYIECVY